MRPTVRSLSQRRLTDEFLGLTSVLESVFWIRAPIQHGIGFGRRISGAETLRPVRSIPEQSWNQLEIETFPKAGRTYQTGYHALPLNSYITASLRSQIPKSYAVNGQCEPCYTSPLQSTKKTFNIPIYTNVNPPTAEIGKLRPKIE